MFEPATKRQGPYAQWRESLTIFAACEEEKGEEREREIQTKMGKGKLFFFFFSCRCKKGTSCFFFFSFKCQAERSQASLLSTTFRAHTSSCPGGTLTSRLLVHFPFHFHFFSFLFLFFFFFFGANVFFLLFVSPGMGSQGHVCSANDEVTKKQVAIKKILHSFQDVEMAKRQV